MSQTSLTIRLFGPMECTIQGEAMPRLRSRSVGWLLALLTLRHGRIVERSWLAGTLWPDSDESQALHNLRDNLVHLRKALGSESARLQSPTRDTLRLDLEGAEVDLFQFDAAIKLGTEASMLTAVELYSGVLLEGCMEYWVSTDRTAREQECLRALEDVAEAAHRRKDYDGAIRLLHCAKLMDPLRDGIWRALMRALAAGGDVPAALFAYREYRLLLHEEMRTEPDAETVLLYEQMRTGKYEGLDKRDERPRREEREAPTQTVTPVSDLSPTAPVQSIALPHPLTTLIGREQEVQEIALSLSKSRMVSLTGGGGVGKTRLAIQAARTIASEGGLQVVFVALAALSDPALLPTFVATSLGVRDEEAPEPASLLQSVATWLSSRSVLLVLDNCEHLVEETAALAQTLLDRCPDLHILATSRQRLGITGEVAWRVPSLSVPDVETLPADAADAVAFALTFPAIRLFVERASSTHREFLLKRREEVEAACKICHRLDGIPLAIELAAARVATLSVEEINTRLSQRFRLLTGGSSTAVPRQRTLRALIDWSYDLLTEGEKSLLCRLSVFSGGWTITAAEAVCTGDGIADIDILDLVISLVDKSLVIAQTSALPARYGMLETVRHYAAERLCPEDTATYRRRHRKHFLSFAEETQAKPRGAEHAYLLGALEAEHDNLRLAITGAPDDAEAAEQVLRLVSALQGFWMTRGHQREGRELMRSALSHPVALQATKLRGDVLNGAAGLAFQQGDSAAARQMLEESLAIRRELNDRHGISGSLCNLGNVASRQHDFVAGRALYEECLTINEELGDLRGKAFTLICLGNVALHMGELAPARSQFEESLALLRAQKDKQTIALALINLGMIDKTLGDYTSAAVQVQEALTLARELGNKGSTADSLSLLGEIAAERSEFESARAMLAESRQIRLETGERQGLVELLESYCRLARKEMLPSLTVRLRAAAEQIRSEIAIPMSHLEQDGFTTDMDWARSVLSEADFETAIGAGRKLTLEQAIDLAMA